MKLSALFCFSVSCFFFHASTVEGKLLDSEPIYDDEGYLDVQHGDTFRCPFPIGNFGDPQDCHRYYACFGGRYASKKCGLNFKFDILRRVCLPGFMAFCGNNGKSTQSPPKVTPKPNKKFRCPRFSGTFPHPTDCSKYYTCRMFMATKKTCPENTLFNAVKSSCQPSENVHCGDRQRPDRYSTPVVDAVSTTPNVASSPTIVVETDNPTDIEVENTSPKPTVVPTENVISTEEQREIELPGGNCKEDHVDCIIDKGGDPDDWFECPTETGSYPHPKSNRLFIFCMNWIPSVTKCSPDMIFSKELETCIEA